MRVLIVDDSRAIRRIIGEIMKQLGFVVTEAGNGIEALQRLEELGAPDLVLVDWNMPAMNGLDFIKAVRANPAYSDLPLMMVTTETEMERMALAFMAGVNEYVMKPFDKATILDKLQLLGIGA
jgi:two-component system chemotaxis response regulator CheY